MRLDDLFVFKPEYDAVVKQRDELNAELAQYNQDMKDAAGELLVEMPRPGTDMAKVMIANRLLRNERDAFRAELQHARELIADLTEKVTELENEQGLAEERRQFNATIADLRAEIAYLDGCRRAEGEVSEPS